MSVLICARLGCENIMCDRLSHEYGYICHDCFEELANHTCRDIEDFMATMKPKEPENDEALLWWANCDRTFKKPDD